MYPAQVAFLAILLAALTAAFSCGGKPERMGAAMLFIAALLSPLAEGHRFGDFEAGIAMVDTALLAALLGLAMTSDRRWPAFAAAFQAIAVLTHVARIKAGPVNGNVYADLLVFWSYPVVLSLLCGSLAEGVRGPRRAVAVPPLDADSSIQEFRQTTNKTSENSDDLALLTRLLSLHSIGLQSPQVAAHLLANAGSFASAVSVPPNKLRAWGFDDRVVEALGFARSTTRSSLRRKLETRRSLARSEEAIDYLFNELAHLPNEQFRVLYLNARYRLILDEILGDGTVTEAPVFPREVVKKAIETGAMHLILAHNHPSGDPTPSRADIAATRAIREAARAIGVTVLDHIVVSVSGHVSMRAAGLI